MKMSVETKVVEAVNGVKIPQLGFGVYKIKKKEEFETAISEAIRIVFAILIRQKFMEMKKH